MVHYFGVASSGCDESPVELFAGPDFKDDTCDPDYEGPLECPIDGYSWRLEVLVAGTYRHVQRAIEMESMKVLSRTPREAPSNSALERTE
jgi:hypothetical protein